MAKRDISKFRYSIALDTLDLTLYLSRWHPVTPYNSSCLQSLTLPLQFIFKTDHLAQRTLDEPPSECRRWIAQQMWDCNLGWIIVRTDSQDTDSGSVDRNLQILGVSPLQVKQDKRQQTAWLVSVDDLAHYYGCTVDVYIGSSVVGR